MLLFTAAISLLLERIAAVETSGFCCFASADPKDVCGTCYPIGIAGASSVCSRGREECESCGSNGITWCTKKSSSNAELQRTTLDGSESTTTLDSGTEAANPSTTHYISNGSDSSTSLHHHDNHDTSNHHNQNSSSGKKDRRDENSKASSEPAKQHQLVLSFPGERAPHKGKHVTVEVNGRKYGATIVEVSVETQMPTPAPTPTPTVKPVKPSIEAVKQHGKLTVSGSMVVDEKGRPVRLRGMSLFWSQWMPQYWNADVVNWLKRDWHVTVIRAAMAVENGGYLRHSDDEKAKLETVVEACIEAGIYVIIDWHDYHGSVHQDYAKAFFAEMSKKYGKHPNVLFEIYNEPQQLSWSKEIKPYHEEIVSVIRKHSRNIIILGTRTWSQEVDVASKDPVEGDNLAYTIHFYAASMGRHLRAKVQKALANGIAVFATEWGTCEYTGNGQLDLDETGKWLDFFEQHHVSDVNWAVSDKPESCSALRAGASGTGGWDRNQLTESGRFVRKSIREYNSADDTAISESDAEIDDRTPIFMRKHAVHMRHELAMSMQSGNWTIAMVAVAVGLFILLTAISGAAARFQARLRTSHQRFLALDGSPCDRGWGSPLGTSPLGSSPLARSPEHLEEL